MRESEAEPKASPIQLETSRLLLRAAVPDDAEYLNKVFTDKEAMKYW